MIMNFCLAFKLAISSFYLLGGMGQGYYFHTKKGGDNNNLWLFRMNYDWRVFKALGHCKFGLRTYPPKRNKDLVVSGQVLYFYFSFVYLFTLLMLPITTFSSFYEHQWHYSGSLLISTFYCRSIWQDFYLSHYIFNS